MSKALDTAELYFQLSNKSDFEGIAKLFTDLTVYSSQNTGQYVGVDEILKMQKAFHSKFSSLNWTVVSVNEVNPGVVRFEYNFNATKLDGEVISSAGIEDLVIQNGKILRIEIKNR